MRKIILPIICLAIAYGCRKEVDKQGAYNTNNLTIADAKTYLQDEKKVKDNNIRLASSALLRKLSLSTTNSESKAANEMGYTYWKKARIYNLNGTDIVEVPFISQNKIVSLYNFASEFISEEEEKERMRFVTTNLLIYMNSEGKKESAFVTYIPDASYLKGHKSGDIPNCLEDIKKGYFGYIEYKDWNQNVLFVLRVRNGEVYKLNVNNADTKNSTQARTLSVTETCRTECTPIYEKVCVGPVEGSRGGSEECTERKVGENCVRICESDPGPSDPPAPGGGDTDGGGGGDGASFVNSIFDTQNLCNGFSQENVNKLIEEVNLLSSSTYYGKYQRCFNRYMLNYLKQTGQSSKLKLCMHTSGNAHYDSEDKAVKFNGEHTIDVRFIQEELFHAFQDKVYPGGISQYNLESTDPALNGKGKSDIEFEFAVLADLMFRMDGGIPTRLGGKEYSDYINGLTNGGTSLSGAKNHFTDPPTQQYMNFLEMYKQAHSEYNFPAAKLNRLAIQKMLESNACLFVN